MQYGMMAQAAGSLLGSWLGYKGQKSANATNIQLQQDQEQWEDKESSTAYQRGIADMKAAGLNPMLAASAGGASTPNVAPAQVSNALGSFVGSAERAASGMQAMQAIKQSQATTDNIDAQTAKTKSETIDQQINTAKALADVDVARQNYNVGVQQEWNAESTRRNIDAQTANTQADTQNKQVITPGLSAESSAKAATFAQDVARRKAESDIAGYGAQKLKSESEFWNANNLAGSLGKSAGVVMDLFKFIHMMTSK